MIRTPPESLTVDAITIRRWRADDTASLDEMVRTSVDHLRPWMPWVQNEPLSLAERTAKISRWVNEWDAAEDFAFAISDGEGQLLGVCGLHRIAEPDSLEIGYWVRAGRTGEGIATRAVQALAAAAFSMDAVAYVEIHVDAANTASARVAEKVGFTGVTERPEAPTAPGEVGIDVTWRLHRHQSSSGV
jgi:RimJ/RimL family protein N-acetyltransferase